MLCACDETKVIAKRILYNSGLNGTANIGDWLDDNGARLHRFFNSCTNVFHTPVTNGVITGFNPRHIRVKTEFTAVDIKPNIKELLEVGLNAC